MTNAESCRVNIYQVGLSLSKPSITTTPTLAMWVLGSIRSWQPAQGGGHVIIGPCLGEMTSGYIWRIFKSCAKISSVYPAAGGLGRVYKPIQVLLG